MDRIVECGKIYSSIVISQNTNKYRMFHDL